MWLKHEGFGDLVRHMWVNRGGDIMGKVSSLSDKLKEWNRESFGCIFHNKRRLLARLQGAQRSLGERFRPGLTKLELKLRKEYNLIIEQEEIFWLQKSRNSWLKEGDRNTKFFHISTMIRRRRNKLEGLKGDDGVWRGDKESMMFTAISYFKNLFLTQPVKIGRASCRERV